MPEEEIENMEQEEQPQTSTLQLSEQEGNVEPAEEDTKTLNPDLEDMMAKETLTEENAMSPLESPMDPTQVVYI
jgi:hypothetical protein